MKSQAVADIIEPDGMNQLRIKQGNHMAPGRIRPGFALNPCFPSQLAGKMRGNQIANLVQYSQFTLAWAAISLGFGFICHPSLWSLDEGDPSTF